MKTESSQKNDVKYGLLLPIVVMALWGALYTCITLTYTKIGVDRNSVPDIFVFVGIRFTLSGGILALITAIKGDFKESFTGKDSKTLRKVCLILFVISILYIVAQYAFTYLGAALVGSANTALIKALGSLVIIPLSCLFFKDDKFSWGKVVAAVVGFFAIVVLNLGKGNPFALSIGQIFVLLSTVSTVTAAVFSKKIAKEVTPFVTTSVFQLLGGLMMLAAGFIMGGHFPTFRDSVTGQFSVVGILIFAFIIVATILSYTIWQTCLKAGKMSKLFVIKLSEPLFTAIFSALIAGEKDQVLRVGFFVAFALLVLAVLIANLWDRVFK